MYLKLYFKILLWLMYLKYFGQNACCILTTKYKIQYKQWCTTTTRPVQCKVTMSRHTKYKVRYCTKRLFAFSRSSCSWCSSVSLLRTNNASDITPSLMNALNLLYEEYFEKLF